MHKVYPKFSYLVYRPLSLVANSTEANSKVRLLFFRRKPFASQNGIYMIANPLLDVTCVAIIFGKVVSATVPGQRYFLGD